MSDPDQLSQKAQKTPEALRSAVAKELEKKKRLGHYSVIWVDNRPVAIGDDAPSQINEPPPDN